MAKKEEESIMHVQYIIEIKPDGGRFVQLINKLKMASLFTTAWNSNLHPEQEPIKM